MKKIYLSLTMGLLWFSSNAQIATFDFANQSENIKQNYTQGQNLLKSIETVKTTKDVLNTALKAQQFADETNRTIQETRTLQRSITGFSGLKVSNFKDTYINATSMITEYYNYLQREDATTRTSMTDLLNSRTGGTVTLYNNVFQKNNNIPIGERGMLAVNVKNGVDNFTGQSYLNSAAFYQKLAKQLEESAGDLSAKLNQNNTIIASPAERIMLTTKCYEMVALAQDLRTKSNDLIRKGTTPTPEQAQYQSMQRRKAVNKYFSKGK